LHPNFNWIANGGLHATGVDDTKAHPIPFDNADQSIAGRSGAIFYDGTSLTNKPIEEGAFANVWTSNEGHQRQPAR
jgi:hypothetical protein